MAAHSPRLVHGCHPQRRPGDGKPQPGLLATRVQVHDGILTPAHGTSPASGGPGGGGERRLRGLPALKWIRMFEFEYTPDEREKEKGDIKAPLNVCFGEWRDRIGFRELSFIC